MRTGKARELTTIDLLETWAYLQGYWQRSRRAYLEGSKRYLCLETQSGTLVVLRDITEPEDDTAALKAIVGRYLNEDGTSRLRGLEVNHWANLVRIEAEIKLPCKLIETHDFDRGADWA